VSIVDEAAERIAERDKKISELGVSTSLTTSVVLSKEDLSMVY